MKHWYLSSDKISLFNEKLYYVHVLGTITGTVNKWKTKQTGTAALTVFYFLVEKQAKEKKKQ